jgi:hypothetical protein
MNNSKKKGKKKKKEGKLGACLLASHIGKRKCVRDTR